MLLAMSSMIGVFIYGVLMLCPLCSGYLVSIRENVWCSWFWVDCTLPSFYRVVLNVYWQLGVIM